MSSLSWHVDENAVKNSSLVQAALKHYVNISESLKDDEVILALKNQIKNNTLPIHDSIRSFLAYIVPKYCGKTQSTFAFGDDLLPLYFCLENSSIKSQPIYNAFNGNANLLRGAFLLDEAFVHKNASARQLLSGPERNERKLYLLGAFDAMISVARGYKESSSKPCSWMEFQTRERHVDITPMTIYEFAEKYPINEPLGEYGAIASSLKDYVIILDEYPNRENYSDPELSASVRMARYIRNFGRAVGIIVMVMSDDPNILNVENTLFFGDSGGISFSDYGMLLWCSVFIKNSKKDIKSLIKDSNCSQYFHQNDIDQFKFQIFSNIDKNIRNMLLFIFKQVKSELRPGIVEIILDVLATILSKLENSMYVYDYFNDSRSLWYEFCKLTSEKIRGIESSNATGSFLEIVFQINEPLMLLKPEENLAGLAYRHLYFLRRPLKYDKNLKIPDAADIAEYEIPEETSVICFDLYRSHIETKNVVRFLNIQRSIGCLHNWFPVFLVPDPICEFFVYISTRGYDDFDALVESCGKEFSLLKN